MKQKLLFFFVLFSSLFLTAETAQPFFLSAEIERPFVIVVPSYNNASWYQKNLDSIFAQEYANYRVIYIDDCSADKTYELVKAYVAERGQSARVTLIGNTKRQGALANHYKACHLCENHEIVVQLDGDDWFKHPRVLQLLNKAYSNANVWLTYGQYETLPDCRPGRSEKLPQAIIEGNAYREFRWVTSALRTFYAGLFKRIQLQDMLKDGEFYPTACDLVFMFPMLEMAAGRVKFIDEIIYVYNCQTGINDFQTVLQKQLHCDNVIRGQKKYKRLTKPPYEQEQLPESMVDIILFASGDVQKTQQWLFGDRLYLNRIKNIYIVYPQSESRDYDSLKYLDSRFKCLPVQEKNFRTTVLNCILTSPSAYTLCVQDCGKIISGIDCLACIELLEQTGARCFNLLNAQQSSQSAWVDRAIKLPPFVPIAPDVFAWQFKYGEFEWRNPNALLYCLYRKRDLEESIKYLRFNSVTTLMNALALQAVDSESIGLCFAHSAVRAAA